MLYTSRFTFQGLHHRFRLRMLAQFFMDVPDTIVVAILNAKSVRAAAKAKGEQISPFAFRVSD
jgi:hypothetical protein